MTLSVFMNDLYGRLTFNIQSDSLHVEDIKSAIEREYNTSVAGRLGHMGGVIRVYNNREEVAHGNIMWWFFGGHSIQLDAS